MRNLGVVPAAAEREVVMLIETYPVTQRVGSLLVALVVAAATVNCGHDEAIGPIQPCTSSGYAELDSAAVEAVGTARFTGGVEQWSSGSRRGQRAGRVQAIPSGDEGTVFHAA